MEHTLFLQSILWFFQPSKNKLNTRNPSSTAVKILPSLGIALLSIYWCYVRIKELFSCLPFLREVFLSLIASNSLKARISQWSRGKINNIYNPSLQNNGHWSWEKVQIMSQIGPTKHWRLILRNDLLICLIQYN